MLHFRSFLITGLMVGAALFLPHNAFAEKNDASVKILPQKAAEQAQAAVVQKKVIHQPAVKRVIKAVPLQAASKKVVVKTRNLAAAQAKGKVVSAAKPKNTVPAANPPGLQKAQAENIKKNPAPQSAVEKTALNVKPVNEVQKETKVQPAKQMDRINQRRVSASASVYSMEHAVSKPVKRQTPPVRQEELPKINQMLNQTQRSNSSGGDSNERVTHGSVSIYGMDKWLEGDIFQQSQLVQLFVSRKTFFQNQWTNAPPSPPPQKAPFF